MLERVSAGRMCQLGERLFLLNTVPAAVKRWNRRGVSQRVHLLNYRTANSHWESAWRAMPPSPPRLRLSGPVPTHNTSDTGYPPTKSPGLWTSVCSDLMLLQVSLGCTGRGLIPREFTHFRCESTIRASCPIKYVSEGFHYHLLGTQYFANMAC